MASFDSAMEMMKEVEKMRSELGVAPHSLADDVVTTFCKEKREQSNEVTVREIVNAYVNEQKTRPTNPAWDKFWES